MKFSPALRFTFVSLSLMVLTVLVVAPVQAGPTIYVDDSVGQLAKLDVTSGNSTILGMMPTVMTDIAFSPTGTLYAVDRQSDLWQINAITATGIEIGAVGIGVNSLVFGKDGTLYAAGGNTLFKLNTTTGAATELGSFGNYFSEGDLAFDPAGNLLLSASSGIGSDDLLRLDTHTGAGTLIGPTGFNTVYGLGLGPNNILYGVTSGTEQVITINTMTGAGTLLSSYGGQFLAPIYGSSFLGESQPVPEVSTLVSFGLLLALSLGSMVVAAKRKKADIGIY